MDPYAGTFLGLVLWLLGYSFPPASLAAVVAVGIVIHRHRTS